MLSRRPSRKKFWKDLTRPHHMVTVSAVLLATTFAPLLGVPDVQELHTFQHAVESFSDARASVLEPRRDDEAARERSARTVVPELPQPASAPAAPPNARRVLTVERVGPANAAETEAEARAEAIEAEELAPIPEDDVALTAPVEAEDMLPDVAETPALSADEAPLEDELDDDGDGA